MTNYDKIGLIKSEVCHLEEYTLYVAYDHGMMKVYINSDAGNRTYVLEWSFEEECAKVNLLIITHGIYSDKLPTLDTVLPIIYNGARPIYKHNSVVSTTVPMWNHIMYNTIRLLLQKAYDGFPIEIIYLIIKELKLYWLS